MDELRKMSLKLGRLLRIGQIFRCEFRAVCH